jgi:hypothetical protein
MNTYHDRYVSAGPQAPGERILVFSWRQHAARTIAFTRGPDAAGMVMAGLDPFTQADIGRWNSLGQRAAA